MRTGLSNNTHYIFVESEDGKLAAYERTINNSNDIASIIKSYNGKTRNLVSVNVADTKKDAIRIANAWNEFYKINGYYLYS